MICCTFDVDVWAFDSDAVKALKDMKPMDMEKLVAKYSILLDPDSELLPQNRPNTLVSIQENPKEQVPNPGKPERLLNS